MVISIAVSTIYPVIVKVQLERQAIRQERLGEEVLHYYFYKSYYNDEPLENEVIKGDTIFRLNSFEEANETILCIEWQGRNGREYERCLSSRKNM